MINLMDGSESGIHLVRERRSAEPARTLGAISRYAELPNLTRVGDLQPGDCVIISTKNSVYRLVSLGGNQFRVSGGWFDRNPDTGTVTVNGCTFGGTAICTDIVAANGLFLEFSNNVSTTRIRDVRVVRPEADPLIN